MDQSGRMNRWNMGLFEWLRTLMALTVCMVLTFTFVCRIVRVDGSSMAPTLADGELLLVWTLGYSPGQGDVVVLNKTTAPVLEGEAIVKRIVALEGQGVELDYGADALYLDGAPLDEPYLLEAMRPPLHPEMQQTRFRVPARAVFVLGDNRNGSTDSRHSGVGSVDRGYLLGRAVAALWPPARFGPL